MVLKSPSSLSTGEKRPSDRQFSAAEPGRFLKIFQQFINKPVISLRRLKTPKLLFFSYADRQIDYIAFDLDDQQFKLLGSSCIF